MLLSAITAVGQNNVIGKDNTLPWRLPADMRFFKNTTMGHAVIMGRKTYESFGKALPGRTNIVITRQSDYILTDAMVVHGLEQAILEARETEKEKASENEEIFILGGAEIYRQSMQLLNRIYLTRVYGDFEGDAFFPEMNLAEWEMLKEERHEPDEKNKYAYAFQLWQRKGMQS
ncbi:MAG TPA: dihydrofolate reductase [Chitinophagaceae bacterium]|nr:dihydrofolate reductase [Chitinophagaceae bacterium]